MQPAQGSIDRWGILMEREALSAGPLKSAALSPLDIACLDILGHQVLQGLQ